MRKKFFGMGAAAVVFIAIGSLAGLVNADNAMQAPAEEIVIEGKKPARFSHPLHLEMGMDCGVCHHDQEHQPLTAEAIAALGDPGKLSCVSCHNSEHPDKDLQKAKDIFHANCKTCHEEGYEGKNGPTKCTDCHIKTKKALEGC
ncbi:MAG: cytochrome c3 family protein [Desulfobulbaceae bacterium]|nr:cytochrome c3 family protein [Desulfobulbaceae bacterium]